MRLIGIAAGLAFCSLAFGQVEEARKLVAHPDSVAIKRIVGLLASGDDEAKKFLALDWIKNGQGYEAYLEALDSVEASRRRDDIPEWPLASRYDSLLNQAGDEIKRLALRKDEVGDAVLVSLTRFFGNVDFYFDGTGMAGNRFPMRTWGVWGAFHDALGAAAKDSPKRFEPYLESADAAVLDGAIDAMENRSESGIHYKPIILAALAKRVDDTNPDVRCIALRYLLRYGSETYAKEVKWLIAKATPDMMAEAANNMLPKQVEALYGKVPFGQYPPAVRLFLLTRDMDSSEVAKLAFSDPNPEVAAMAACSLASMKGSGGINQKWLDAKFMGRTAAQRHLDEIAEEDPEIWLSLLQHDRRLLAYNAFYHLEGLEPEVAAKWMMELIPLLESADISFDVPGFIIPGWDTFEPVAERMMKSKKPKVRKAILDMICRSPLSSRYALRFLSDPDPEVRLVLMCLGGDEFKQVAPTLIPLALRSKDRDLVFDTMRRIVDEGLDGSFHELKRMASSPDKQFAEFARALLVR